MSSGVIVRETYSNKSATAVVTRSTMSDGGGMGGGGQQQKEKATILRVAIAQMTSTEDSQQNFKSVQAFMGQAKAHGCDFIALPECFDWIVDGQDKSRARAQPLDGNLFTKYRSLCASFGIAASFGGFHEAAAAAAATAAAAAAAAVPPSPSSPSPSPPSPSSPQTVTIDTTTGHNDDRISNTHVIVDSNGEISAVYRKTHLFDADIADGAYRESDNTRPGQTGAVVLPLPQFNQSLGLTTCYDVRFPGLYGALRTAGATIHLVPSAFMPSTGAAHWETLLRARAIETQCFVVAAAQVGQHTASRGSYGHSLIVGPWGNVLARLDGEKPGLAYADLDFAEIERVRQKMPVEAHARPELYNCAAIEVVKRPLLLPTGGGTQTDNT